ncbi:hypothetical protein [Veillonella seminalis]|nr:hypothetical protein [Veillonella seminalis]
MSNEENFIIMLVIGLGWLAAFHFLAFSKAWEIENIDFTLLLSSG